MSPWITFTIGYLCGLIVCTAIARRKVNALLRRLDEQDVTK